MAREGFLAPSEPNRATLPAPMKIMKLRSWRPNSRSLWMITQAQKRMPTIKRKSVPRLLAIAARLLVKVIAECSPSIAAKWQSSR